MSRFRRSAELWEEAQAQRFKISDMPLEVIPGYPVPVLRESRLTLAVPFFPRKGNPPSAPVLFSPGWIVYIDAESGSVSNVERRDVDYEKPLGPHELPKGWSMADLRVRQERLLTQLDELLPLVERGLPSAPPPGAQVAMRAFADLWRELAHKPALECYRQLNPRWFEYLGL